ncbi:MAG: hypothetical protein K2W96_25080 [Gemmataceae bacterium]|nr:hypothetical protein [Gemmataceae bacterium]
MAARYTLEPTLRDIYVEGLSDATIVKEALRVAGCRNAIVYVIDTVDVPPAILAARKLSDGNKGRVIALCQELEARGIVGNEATGIMDRDCDGVLGIVHASRMLLTTDYACMEMYFFDDIQLGRFCERFLHREAGLAGRLLALLRGPLVEVFFIRATNEAMALGLTWLATDRQVTVAKGALEFQPDIFIDRYLNSNSMLGEKAAFLAKRNQLRSKMDADPRHNIHGHDFVDLLSKCLQKEGIEKALADPLVIERSLPAGADFASLSAQPMFQALIARVR